MGPLLSMVSVLFVATTPASACYVPSDQTAGWKRVALPEDAPALAAPTGIDQFRAGERAFLHEEDPQNMYQGASKQHPGRMAYSFWMPKGTFRMELDFFSSLDGAKVDATAYSGGRAYPLLSGRRHSGGQLALEWNVRDVDSVVVEVHHHLREEPVVRHWRVDREVLPSHEVSVPTAFQGPRMLYFRHPGGRRIELCDTPNQPLVLSRWPEGVPTDVTLRRQSAVP
ncbi:MAG: hypothetical protein ACJ8AT_39650 [Hyalangium sp.]|uniref:hypothetical protein n=1 Tax=Hyalangium sp. TaxID=2028555 RepID=UPI00389A8691